jgi:hypothetical protein
MDGSATEDQASSVPAALRSVASPFTFRPKSSSFRFRLGPTP